MGWSHKDLRELRQRLGWSVSEMARRLGCRHTQLVAWESGEAHLDPEVINQCQYLYSYVEEQNNFIQKRPIAESILKENGFEQISEDFVLEWEVQNSDT